METMIAYLISLLGYSCFIRHSVLLAQRYGFRRSSAARSLPMARNLHFSSYRLRVLAYYSSGRRIKGVHNLNGSINQHSLSLDRRRTHVRIVYGTRRLILLVMRAIVIKKDMRNRICDPLLVPL
jgi:hypothetical protein